MTILLLVINIPLAVVNAYTLVRIYGKGGTQAVSASLPPPPPPPPSGTARLSPPPPPFLPPPPPTTLATPSSSGEGDSGTVEYKLVSWHAEYYEGYTCICSPTYNGLGPETPGGTRPCANECWPHSTNNSFVDVMRSERVSDVEIFTDCSYPKLDAYIKVMQMTIHGSTAPTDQELGSVGEKWGATITTTDRVYPGSLSLDRWYVGGMTPGAPVAARKCVLTKLIETLRDANWTLVDTSPELPFLYPYIYKETGIIDMFFARQNATLS